MEWLIMVVIFIGPVLLLHYAMWQYHRRKFWKHQTALQRAIREHLSNQ